MKLGTTPTKKAKPIRLCYGQLEAIFRFLYLTYFYLEI